jgi:hypothetical protein
MTNIPIRFGRGRGLEAAANVQTQAGLTELRNVALDLREVVQKRDGSEQVALTIGANPEDVLDPIGLQAVAFRGEELVIWSDRSLYSRSQCAAADETSGPVGVATDAQVTQARTAANAALRARQSITLAGYIDAPSVTGTPTNRPTSSSAAGPGPALCLVQRTSSGGVTATVSGTSGGFAIVGGAITLFTGGGFGGTDVRAVYIGDHVFPGGGGTGPYFAAAWREGDGDTLRWTVLQPSLGGSGVSYAATATQTVSTGNRPYDLVYQDTVTDGELATLIYSASAGTISARSREETFPYGTLLQRDVTLAAGISLLSSDVVRGVAEALTLGGQTAALFLRRGGRNEYRPLRFDAAFTQRSIRIPPATSSIAPVVIRSSDDALQVVGVRDAVTSGLHVFTGSPVDVPAWVAAVASGGSGTLTGAHTVEGEQTADAWTLRRDGLECLDVAQDGGEVRALLAVAGVVVGLIAEVPVLRRWSWQPAGAGPTPAYQVIANTAGHLAAAQSANRVAYLYQGITSNQIEVVSSDDGLTFVSSGLEFLPAGEGIAQAHGDLIIDTETGGGGVTASWYYLGDFSGTAKIARREVSSADAVQGVPLATAAQASVSSLHASDFTTFRLVVLNIVPTGTQGAVTYEFGADYVVQVDPRLVTLAAGNFQRRGPWTAAKLRQEVPIQAFGGGTVIACDVGEIQGCRVAMWQVSGGTVAGVYVAIMSDHIEAGPTRIDATGTRPLVVVNHGDGSALLTYLSAAGVIQKARWTPGGSIAFASAGFTPINAVYTTLAVSTEDGNPRHKYVILGRGAGAAQHRVQRLNATTLAVLFDESFTVGDTPSANVVAAAIETSGSDFFRLRACHPGLTGVSTWRLLFPDGAGGSITTTNNNSFTVAPANVGRLAIASPDGTSNYHLLIERTNESGVTLASNATTEPATLRRRYFRHTVWTNAERIDDDKTYAVLAGGYGGFNASASYWLLDLDTGEIVGRAFAEEGESSATRAARLMTGHVSVPSLDFAADRTRVLYAAAVQSRGSSQIASTLGYLQGGPLTAVGFAATIFYDEPFTPAELDRVLVHAHAGYARCYAGDLPHEQDFHCWPVAVSITTPVGGSLSAGSYSAILMYEAPDAQGHVQRSFGNFIGPATAAANDQFTVAVTPLSMTERRDVLIVMYRTTAGGSVYYRDVAIANTLDGTGNVNISGTQSDTLLAVNEELDLTLVPRNPGPATDMIAAVGGRFMTRDPERGALARFTTPRLEGLAPWWSFAQGLEVPSQRDITAIGDLDGRVVLFTALDVAVAQGEGPSATGAGAFNGPDRQAAEIGALGQPSLAEIPQGIVFGSSAGPRLLTRGLETFDLGEGVYRYFEQDGYVVGRCLYLPDQGTLLIAARRSVTDELVLRWHVTNGRWAEDTGRPILDMSASRAGVVAYLGRDGRLLLEGDAPITRYQNLLALRSLLGRYPEYMFAGGLADLVTGAPLELEGGAFLSEDVGTPGVFNRTSYDATGVDGESVVAEDTAIADLGTGASLALCWSQTFDVAPAVTRGILGKMTMDAGPFQGTGFLVTGEAAGVRLLIDPDTGSSTQVDLTAASHTAGERRWFVAVIDFEAQLVRLASDVETEVSASIAAPGEDYSTTAPLRFLDALDDATPPMEGRIHWAALYRGEDLSAFLPDCNAAAQALKAADEQGIGVSPLAALADRTDGEQGYVTSCATPWMRQAMQDGLAHPGFTFQGAAVFGKYLGSHELTIEVFYDFAAEPELVTKITRQTIDDDALAGRPYLYRIEDQDRRCYAVLVRFADAGEPNPTLRAEGLDICYKNDGGQPAELPSASIAQRST